MDMRLKWRITMALGLIAALGGCSQTPADAALDDVALLLSVEPSGGSLNVAVDRAVVVTFSHALATGAERYAALHEGSVQGVVVSGTWKASPGRVVLTFKPDAPLKPATAYAIHLGGSMSATAGHMVDLGTHGLGMGGQWAGGAMMGGMGGIGSASMTMMGSGWSHPTNGSYGMVFAFGTAG